jgi:signal peptidase I
MSSIIFGLILCLSISLLTILVLVRVALVLVTVQFDSMSPTLQHDDRVLVLRYWPARWLRKGDIVLVWPWLPRSGSLKALSMTQIKPFIKRIIGLPGDTLTTTLAELDATHKPAELLAHDTTGQRVWYVPSGHLFLRGDNFIGGFDSLSWGPVPFHCVLGIVIMRLPRKKTLNLRNSSH